MSDVNVPSPKASRQSRPKWLDPKLFLGILLVLASMAGGAKIIGDAATTTKVWAAKADIPAGMTVTPDMMKAADVHFSSQGDADAYIGVTEDWPANTRAVRAISGNEFVPRTSVSAKKDPDLIQLALPVTNTSYPELLADRDKVDVWFAPKSEGGSGEEIKADQTKRALVNVLVIKVPAGGSVGSDAKVTVQVNLGVDKNGLGNAITENTQSELIAQIAGMKAFIAKHAAEGSAASTEDK